MAAGRSIPSEHASCAAHFWQCSSHCLSYRGGGPALAAWETPPQRPRPRAVASRRGPGGAWCPARWTCDWRRSCSSCSPCAEAGGGMHHAPWGCRCTRSPAPMQATTPKHENPRPDHRSQPRRNAHGGEGGTGASHTSSNEKKNRLLLVRWSHEWEGSCSSLPTFACARAHTHESSKGRG